jgi:hypothetical protein
MFYKGCESGLVTLAGKDRTCTDTYAMSRGQADRFGWGLFERFNVLKRFVDAEIDWIEDDVV